MIKYKHEVWTILQYNCNRSTNVMQGMMESGANGDIIAIQEPWIGKIQGKKKKKKGRIEVGGGEMTVGNKPRHHLSKGERTGESNVDGQKGPRPEIHNEGRHMG